MPKITTELKVISFPALFVRSLSKDFENKKITWNNLYDSLFIAGTDIYREMKVTLHSFGLKIKDIINYEYTFEITKKTEVIFELEEDNGKKFLTHMETKEQIIIPKNSSINQVLAKIGYTQKTSKFE